MMACRRLILSERQREVSLTWAPSLNFRQMRLRGAWAQPWMALHTKAWEPYCSFPWSGSNANPIKPGVAADRKKAPLRAAVAGGADLRTFRYAGDVFSDPDKTAGSELIAGPDAALGERDAWGLQRRGFRSHPQGFSQ